MVLVVDTPLDPYAFLRRCHRVEAAAGRVRAVRWGSRTLDVDVLFHGDARIESAQLTVPHPRINERRFVLQPLSEVAPERTPAGWDSTLPTEDIRPLGPLDDL
jgi:2-amino-4-hydroxy-6-hydroxymethyldihydropteridine diphosphokinase